MIKKILVTGVSGAGKSTLEQVFREMGHQTIDIDYGFAGWRDQETGERVDYSSDDAEKHSEIYWALEAKKLEDRLDEAGEDDILVFGSANDLHQHVELFTQIFLLEYPNEEAILDRLAMRSSYGYGKTKHERDAVLSYYKDYQDTMKRLGANVIDCTLPLEQIVQMIATGVRDE